MELRKLQASDLFAMVKIINGIGVKNVKDAINVDEIREAREKSRILAEKGENTDTIASELGTSIMMNVLAVVLEHLPTIEKDVYNFIANLADKKASDIAKMELNEFTDVIIEIFQKEEFMDFFKRASKLVR